MELISRRTFGSSPNPKPQRRCSPQCWGQWLPCTDLWKNTRNTISPSVFWPEKSYLFWSALPPLWFRVRTRLWFPASWFCWLPFPLHDRPHVGPDAIMFKHHQCIRILLWQFTYTWRHVLFETKVGTILVAILHTFLGERWHFSMGISWTNFANEIKEYVRYKLMPFNRSII